MPLRCSLGLDLCGVDRPPSVRYLDTASLWSRILHARSSKPLHFPICIDDVLTLKHQFVTAKTYDYHPPMGLPDSESPECSLGDCAICMDAIIIDPPAGEKGTTNSTEATWPGTADGPSHGIFSILRRNVVGTATMRKSYSLAPCHHLFVSFGLWVVH